jgi:hypothetical protein
MKPHNPPQSLPEAVAEPRKAGESIPRQLPPRVQEIVNVALDGMTGDIFTDLLRIRYSLMLIYRESDFGDDAHQRRSSKWIAGIVPTTMGGGSNVAK